MRSLMVAGWRVWRRGRARARSHHACPHTPLVAPWLLCAVPACDAPAVPALETLPDSGSCQACRRQVSGAEVRALRRAHAERLVRELGLAD